MEGEHTQQKPSVSKQDFPLEYAGFFPQKSFFAEMSCFQYLLLCCWSRCNNIIREYCALPCIIFCADPFPLSSSFAFCPQDTCQHTGRLEHNPTSQYFLAFLDYLQHSLKYILLLASY